jgi:hypothetical protein
MRERKPSQKENELLRASVQDLWKNLQEISQVFFQKNKIFLISMQKKKCKKYSNFRQ